MTFGQRLKQLRVESKLTQSELGERINLSKSNISKYESNDVEPNIQTIKDIATLFNCSIDYLLDNEEQSQLRVSQNDVSLKDVSLKDPSTNTIETLSEESKKELEKYIQLLKMKDGLDKGKDEQSSTLEKEA